MRAELGSGLIVAARHSGCDHPGQAGLSIRPQAEQLLGIFTRLFVLSPRQSQTDHVGDQFGVGGVVRQQLVIAFHRLIGSSQEMQRDRFTVQGAAVAGLRLQAFFKRSQRIFRPVAMQLRHAHAQNGIGEFRIELGRFAELRAGFFVALQLFKTEGRVVGCGLVVGLRFEHLPIVFQRVLEVAKLELEVSLGPGQFGQVLAAIDGVPHLAQRLLGLPVHVESQRLGQRGGLHRPLLALGIENIGARQSLHQLVVHKP